jgi:antitoxin ParD1/3/4
MPARNVSLTPRLARFVDENVETGRFQNASEVVREGLRLLEQRQAEDALKLAALRVAIEVGRDDIRHGRVIEIEAGQERAFLATLGRTGSREP